MISLSSTEGWIDLMNSGIDHVGINMQPQYNHRTYFALYFVIALLLIRYFLHNFLLAILIDSFYQKHTNKRIGDGNIVNSIQKQWIEVNTYWVQRKLKYRPIISKKRFIQSVHRLLESKWYTIS